MSESLDPVTAYDRIAPVFAELAGQRRAYLDAIERLIVAGIPPGSRSLLDVGAGNGSRARRIARDSGVSELTLLEPAIAMQQGSPEMVSLRAEDLHCLDRRFDVILCLWNVLGHIFPAAARVEVLRQFARVLSPQGKAFVDVNHRYNARQYGVLPTIARYVGDRFRWRSERGDVAVRWDLGGIACSTKGHVFTHREFQSLCASGGLKIDKRIAVDYATGCPRRWTTGGHLLYVLSRPASPSPPSDRERCAQPGPAA